MTEVIPAILAKSFEEVSESIAHFVNVATVVQIDICDGSFVPSTSWPYNDIRSHNTKHIDSILDEEAGMPFWDSMDFEFDLMVRDASKQFELWCRLGAKRMVFHLEAEENSNNEFKEFLEGLDMYTKENIDIGLAINVDTSVDALSPFISHIDFVQCMGIEHIGMQGEPFDERVLDQIKELRLKYPELIISVDGSVNINTARELVKAGANRLIIGSALAASYDLRETIREFENL